MRLYHGKYWHPQILVEEELATPAITQINPQHHQGQTRHSMYSILCLYFARHITLCIVYIARHITLYLMHIQHQPSPYTLHTFGCFGLCQK